MIFGIGTDIVKVNRFEKWVDSEKICSRFFNEAEIINKGTKESKCEHYAARFAAKEAFSKALGTGFVGLELRDIYVTNDEKGKPILNVNEKIEKILKEKCSEYEIHLSLSHEKEFAVAFVIIETK